MDDSMFSRQSFLGDESGAIFAGTRIGVVGVSGGGSQVLPQLTLVGVRDFVLFDPKVVEAKHFNRNPMLDFGDAEKKRKKTEAAARRLERMAPDVRVEPYAQRWQENVAPLQRCDIVVGCVDGFSERLQLESECRRFLIPYVDLGLDVTQVVGERPRLAGQVVLSMPGYPCLRCLGVVTDEKLRREAADYGGGPRAQVGWANGMLACAATNLIVDLLTNWSGELRGAAIRSFDANRCILVADPRAEVVEQSCEHFPLTAVALGPA